MQGIISALRVNRKYFKIKDLQDRCHSVKENLPPGQGNAGVRLKIKPSNEPITRPRVSNLCK